MTEKPFLVILDEHQELMQYDIYKFSNSQEREQEEYFGPFKGWSGLPGRRVFTVLSGSGHSVFERSVPVGEEGKLRYIEPFQRTEAIKLISKLEVGKKFGVSPEVIYDEITGGVPGHIASLSSAESVTMWIYYIRKWYYHRASAILRNLQKRDKESHLEFLGSLFETKSLNRIPPWEWYDKGFFYIHQGHGFVLNPLARVVLLVFWVLQEDVFNGSGAEMDAVFERKIRRAIIAESLIRSINLEPYYIKNNRVAKTTLGIPSIEQIVLFENEADIPPPPTLISSLLKPQPPSPQDMDFIIQDVANKQIIFVQTTTLFPQEHDKKTKKIENMVESGRMVQVLEGILKVKGATASIKDGRLKFTLPKSVRGWKVKILYLTSQHDRYVKKNKDWKWKNVLIAGDSWKSIFHQ
eukprot:TRINITY_DN17766_c0_g1_i1.p1 TRINITY_DN17766_c0_g1~~TRINITY_DN17766_c0_g1_i1.p1  ORF type:complete len:434 (+),score=96.19 TRINITY_DN17766_c0_g1_i1:77-1303(+)